MVSPASTNRPARHTARPDVPRPRDGRRVRPASAGPPDLAAVAREAVVSFLHDASAQRQASRSAAAQQEANADAAPVARDAYVAAGREAGRNTPAAEEGADANADPAASEFAAQSVALRAAAMSVATLDRIEAAAAKVEADIVLALQAHAELQAGAGAAAEVAVNAAQDAWVAAGTAVEADKKARNTLRVIARYAVTITVLVVIEIIIFVLFATAA